MDKFKLETSFQFPFFKLNEIVSYLEVKKPSGIAYMLLVLINESNDKNALLSQVLENFGVPRSIHYIYADTIANLILQDILTTRCGEYFDRNMFSSFRIGDVAFTPKGKKIFAEESIPTGVTKEAKIPVYFDIAMRQLALTIPTSFEPKPLIDSAITEEFMDKFSCDKNIEDFVNKNKGTRIPIYENGKVAKYELIKKEEIITKVEEISKENWTGKYDCTVVLEGNSLSFAFEEKTVQKFFDENYTSQMVNKAIGYKNKFKFKSEYTDGLDLSAFADKEIASIIIPKEIDDVLKQKGQMLISKGNYKGNNYYIVESVSGIQKYDASCEFIVVDQADNKFAFIPGVFKFNNKDLGTISIPLVLRTKVSSSQLKEVLESFVNNLNQYSEENFKTLVKVTNVSKDYEKASEIMCGYLTNDYESNIVLLNEMKPTAMMNANIMTKYKELLSSNYESYLKTVTEDNLETVLKITNSIPKFLNITLKDVIARIFECLKDIKNKQEVYETLIEKGFDKSVVVLYVNPVEDVLRTRIATDKSLLDLVNYDSCIAKLKELSGITDFKKYTFDEEAVNRVEFKKVFNTAKGLQKNIEFFKNQNQELFKSYEMFIKLFGEINDDFNILDAALANPNNIKPELIDKKITSGDYQFVFVNLSAKLEIILKNKYGLDGKLSDMLSEARRSGVIERSIATDLHDFRENRNAYIHPEDRTSNFKADDLRRWSKEIFELGEEKK
ncbi:MAG: hypothetical protein NC310_03205 [Roseburia sp.]|nr:hypothetical protein [Anaeroplasma bactoclasticum]MCM1196067.1 hypothetical protein [Roseburia sp.]MCM1557416.1 hypothetical protein [Anaeroplasma bactoclasticum]